MLYRFGDYWLVSRPELGYQGGQQVHGDPRRGGNLDHALGLAGPAWATNATRPSSGEASRPIRATVCVPVSEPG